MMIAEPKHESGPKELRVKIGVEYHLKLHALKLLRGKRMSEAVEEALEFYFDKVRIEQEAAGTRPIGTTLSIIYDAQPAEDEDPE